LCSWWNLVEHDFGTILDGELKGVGHACEAETSLYLHLVGEGVEMGAAPNDYTWPFLAGVDRSFRADHGVGFPSLHGGWTSGVYGSAALATPEKGRRLLEAAAARLAAFCARFHAIDLDAPAMWQQL